MCREQSASFPSEVGVGNQDISVDEIRRCSWPDQAGFTEPTLSELLEDPVIRRLMTSDGVDLRELRTLLTDLRVRLARDEASPGEPGCNDRMGVFADRVLSR